MKGDFSRLTFDSAKQYSRVLMQQGRIQLDADWNEQADIFQHYLRTLAADLIGPFGAPPEADGTAGLGFKLMPRRNFERDIVELSLLPGRYYVDGIAVENPREGSQPGPFAKNTLFYLDVWERHITYLQDDLLREVALLGPDTATRSKVVWRVRTAEDIPDDLTCRSLRREWSRWVDQWQSPYRGRLKAQARPGTPDDTDPCLASPEARYRGENQLYRVEIHQGGGAGAGGTATYKWSADNGSVVFPVRTLASEDGKTTVTLEHLGRGDGPGLLQGDWVEVVDGEEDQRDGTDLLKVETVDADRRQVVLKGTTDLEEDATKPMLRRWDHRRGTKPSDTGVYSVAEGTWLDLEDGVQIWFAKPDAGAPANAYRAGDYWLIPARVATGDVEWPRQKEIEDGKEVEGPKVLPPRGVEHHFAPLGLLTRKDGKAEFQDCRTTLCARAVSLTTGVADWQLMATPTTPEVFNPQAPPPRPADVVANPAEPWGLIPGARWISASTRQGRNSSNHFIAGDYTYELHFDLCSCVHQAALWLDFFVDNTAEVFLNGMRLGEQTDKRGFEKQKPPLHLEASGQNQDVTPNRPWLDAGDNVLKVVVTNNEGPTGLILRGAVDTGGCRCC